MKRHRLKLTSLKFISSVDTPAQETAVARLVKRANAPIVVQATARVAKLSSDELGLVFGWALTTKSAGADYWDLHGDNIVEDDLIAVAAAFMEAGGAADTMHDRVEDGRVVFAMPLTAEVAKAFGIATDTHGLMVAIKPSAEDFLKFKSGELTGFSIDGMGERTPAEKSTTQKTALFTDEVLGHQHTIDLTYCGEIGSWYTSYQNAEGEDHGHSHAVMRSADGRLVILADGGHTHELADGQPNVLVVPEGTTIVVENRAPDARAAFAPAAKSTRPPATAKVNDMKLVVLTEAQHAHYSKLAPADAEAFAAKSALERDSEVAKFRDADPVVYKTASGIEVRKSHGDIAIMLAKQADESATAVAKATEIANVEKAARELTELTKRADALLGALAGTDAVHVEVLRAVESIIDTKKRDAAIATLKAANDAMKAQGTAAGANGSSEIVSKSADDQIDELAKKYATDNKVPFAKAYTAVMASDEGRAIYAQAHATNRPTA